MNETNSPEPRPSEEDAALARRLARLGQKPVDTQRLEHRLDAAFASLDDADQSDASPSLPPPPFRLGRWLPPAAGLAAMLALAATLFFVFFTTPPTASAAVVDLSQLHRQVEEGRVAIPVGASIDVVSQLITEQRGGALVLPKPMQRARVQSCCLVGVQADLIALAVLKDGGPTVSLVVAQSPDFAHEMGVVIEIDSRRFFGHELNGVRMMMANDGDRWLCVMGDRSYEALAQIAAEVRF